MTDTPDPTAAEPTSIEPGPIPPAVAATTADTGSTGWQKLPSRAVLLCTIDVSLSLAVVFAIAGVVLGVLTVGSWVGIASGLSGALLGAGIGTWIGLRRYRNTLWRLDAHGFAVRRGVAWQRETLVPLTRVQHLDLKHGPLQRLRGLATLVVHTAGTRHNAVSIDHLDAQDAERLRERLGRQLDHDEDA
ncbi:PH domain-containing protein [Lysobacter sp. 22409]|uniref:PH domain-containing protein n=1 Tax=Lysobacter sp. 22409 TaxID=3453917 RepID=UPI003F83F085